MSADNDQLSRRADGLALDRSELEPHEQVAQAAVFAEVVVDALHRWGGRLAFDDPQANSYSYDEAAALMAKMQCALRRLGLAFGDGVGILAGNSVEAWMAGTVVQVSGGYTATLQWRASLDDLAFIANDAELSMIVAMPQFADLGLAIAERAPRVRRVLILGPATGAHDLLALAAVEPAGMLAADPAINDDTLCILWYTGGTTGFPKAGMHTHRSVLDAVFRNIQAYEFPRDMRYLAAAPISHAGWPPIVPTLIAGGVTVLMQSFDADRFLDLLEEKEITLTEAVPTMLYALLDAVASRPLRAPRFERFVYGGSPIHPSRLLEAQQVFGNIFTQIYGPSEALGGGTALLADEHYPDTPEVFSSCGKAVPGVRIAILDENNRPVQAGEVGEICLKSRSAMRGYWKQPELTAECFGGGWLHSGDMGRMDERGYVTIVDRKKEVIISGGFNIYPAEIERVLSEVPEVAQSAVIGVPDEIWGEAVKAILVLRAGVEIDIEAVLDHVRRRKGGLHVPKSVDIIAEMPMTPVGKVDKKALRSAYWQSTTRAVN